MSAAPRVTKAVNYVLALAPWHTLPRGADLFLAASTASLAFSGYLAYVLAVVLHEFCIVCASSYVVNTSIFVMAVAMKLQGGGKGKGGKAA